MKRSLFIFLILLINSFLVTSQKDVVKKFYHLGAFVRLQGHPNFDVTLSQYKKMMNDTSDTSFSFKRILHQSSFGKFDYEFVTINSDETDTIPYYYDIMPMGYYLEYSTSNTKGYKDEDDKNLRIHKLTERYIEFLNKNLSDGVKLDGNNDGFIDVLTFSTPGFFPGNVPTYNGNWAGGIPHNQSSKLSVKGLGIQSFSVNIAYSWINPLSNGIFKHEVGHNLGTWDLYDNNNTDRFQYRSLHGDPVGNWDMMVGSSNTYGAYVLWSRLGFIPEEKVNIIDKNGSYRLNSLFGNTDDNVVYRINSPYSENEFFTLEFRSRHEVYEWWNNVEGLVVNLINPLARGNARGNANKTPFEVFQLRKPDGNRMFLNTSLNINSETQLLLSDGSPAGVSINNIRKVGEQLYFDVIFDNKPFVKLLNTADVINSESNKNSFSVFVNKSNAVKWSASTDSKWVKLNRNYKTSKLDISFDKNDANSFRTCKIILSAPGCDDYVTYFVQRGHDDKPVFWSPDVLNDTITISGEEDSHNLPFYGDFLNDWWISNSDGSISNGTGMIRKLHVNYFPIHGKQNDQDSSRFAKLNFKLKDNTVKQIVVKQLPAVTVTKEYKTLLGEIPNMNSNRWYLISTDRAKRFNANYLMASKDADNRVVVGTDYLLNSDAFLWRLLKTDWGYQLQNKAFGNICFNDTSYFLGNCKEASNFLALDTINSTGYYYGTTGLTFTIKSSHKRIRISHNGELTISEKASDLSTLFFNTPSNSFVRDHLNDLYIQYSSSKYSNIFSKSKLNNLANGIARLRYDSKQNKRLQNNLLNIVKDLDKEIDNYISREVKFSVRRNMTNFWGPQLKEDFNHYLTVSDSNKVLVHSGLIAGEIDSRQLYRFVKKEGGRFLIENINYPNEYLKLNTDKSFTVSKSEPTLFEIIPVISYLGIKYLFKISESENEYLRYNSNKESFETFRVNDFHNIIYSRSVLFDLQCVETLN